jgi:hypothetical protein
MIRQKETAMDKEDERGVHIGSITSSGGNVVVAGRDANVNLSGQPADAILKAFAPLLEKAAAMPEGPEKTITQSAVEGLKTEAQKGDKAEEPKVQKWFGYLAENAPDVLEVAISTFVNPILGVGLVFKKIAEKAKEAKKD